MGLREQAAQMAAGESGQAVDPWAAAKQEDAAEAAARAVAAGREAAGLPPDVAESGIDADLGVPVHVAWSRVMGEVQYVGKSASRGLNYLFRGIDAVLQAVGPALRKHGVMVMPIGVAPEYTVVTSKSGAVMNYCRAVVRYVIVGPGGDVLSMPGPDGAPVPLVAESLGEAFDTGDKASTKAQSVALREFYIKALAIPVNEPARDTEHGVQHELAGPRVPTVEEYAAEIQDDTTSLNRLRQIKAELTDDPRKGATEVELFGGEKITLRALVQRTGMERRDRT